MRAHAPKLTQRRLRPGAHAAVALLLLVGSVAADPLAESDRLEPFSLEDQFGETHEVNESLSALICASDMDGGDLIEAALKESGAELLANANAVYVANISRMPKIITKLFAMRSFKKRGYPMLLDREGELTKSLPGQEGKATIISLDRLRIAGVRHFEDGESLRAALAALGEGAEGG